MLGMPLGIPYKRDLNAGANVIFVLVFEVCSLGDRLLGIAIFRRLLSNRARLTNCERGVVIGILMLGLAAAATLFAAEPTACVGTASLGTVQLSVRPFSQGSPLPLKSVAEIPGGARLAWNPMHPAAQASSSAEVAAVLVPASGGHLIVMGPRKAAERTEWQLPDRPQVIALIYGPQGLNEGKIKSLVSHDTELLRQLADYAEQSSQVETLVQELAAAEQSGGNADAVLKGFSSKYGVDAHKLNSASSSDQQATLLLRAVLPSSAAYDPLANQGAQVQQSSGLAASVAGLFFGSSVGLAAGGAVLFEGLKTALFPNTEFRSLFAQSAANDSLSLCTKNATPKAKTRIAYLWAYRVPELKKPLVSLTGTSRLPLGSKSTLAMSLGKGSTQNELEHARDWRLTPVSGGASIPVGIRSTAASSLEIDLSKAKAPDGDYRLDAAWDWDPLQISGTVHLSSYPDFTHVKLPAQEHDKLVEGNGNVAVTLSGVDFEFLEKVALVSAARNAKPADVAFTLPKGKRAGPQNSVTLDIDLDVDSPKPGPYRLLLTQSDGVAHEEPVTVLPPNPKISNLPLRLNLEDTREAIHMQGTGMERVEGASSDAGVITAAQESHGGQPQGWSGEIELKAGLVKGQKFPLLLKVKGLEDPITVPDAIEIVGPRPAIVSVQKSLTGALGIEIGDGELPAGTASGLVLTVNNLHDAARPRLELGCESGELRQSLTVSAGEESGKTSLAFAGPGALYLSVDPGVVGYAGCRLEATVILDPEGRSDPFELGRVIRIPRLDKFTLTAEKIGDSSYAGILEGRDLDVIERVGWDAQNGVQADSIPAPVPGDASRQTLRVVLPWPAPGPHAPLYVWLRGEQIGRKTAVTY
jgi:hypothetical protein